MEKIKKLNITISKPSREKYNQERAEYIARQEEYVPGHSTGWFGWRDGHYEKRPDVGEAKWNELYPNGFDSWAEFSGYTLTSYGEQLVLDKVDELVDAVNGLRELLKENYV